MAGGTHVIAASEFERMAKEEGLWLAEGAVVSDWSATPAVSADYRAARDHIRQQLEILLKDLKK